MKQTINIAITGHRPHLLWGYNLNTPKWQHLKQIITNYIVDKITQNPNTTINLISGIALGVDTIFAQIALELKNKNLPVTLTAAIPFVGQENRWPEQSQTQYRHICQQADNKIIVCQGNFAGWKMNKRNEWMVDNCDELISVWNGKPSGTGNCVNYAKSKNVTIYQINPNTI